jgi:hypothetical protein
VRSEKQDSRDRRRCTTKRVVAKSKIRNKKITKRASVFSIMQRNIYKTSQAVYHNPGNANLKLFSFELVSKNPKNALFTKRVRSELS